MNICTTCNQELTKCADFRNDLVTKQQEIYQFQENVKPEDGFAAMVKLEDQEEEFQTVYLEENSVFRTEADNDYEQVNDLDDDDEEDEYKPETVLTVEIRKPVKKQSLKKTGRS